MTVEEAFVATPARRPIHIIDSKTAGSRPATRVRIVTPEGGWSVFEGRVGTVVTVIGGSVMVRLDPTRGSQHHVVMPFALSEIVEVLR